MVLREDQAVLTLKLITYIKTHMIEIVFRLHYGDLTDSTNIIQLIKETQPMRLS